MRKMLREVNTGRPFEAEFILIILPIITFSQLTLQLNLDCCFMAILSLENYEKTLEQYA